MSIRTELERLRGDCERYKDRRVKEGVNDGISTGWVIRRLNAILAKWPEQATEAWECVHCGLDFRRESK